jgi:transcriptional regulator with XRE-family HTH domain
VGASREYGNKEFGALLDGARKRRGWSKSKLGREIGTLPVSGRVYDAAGVARILSGGSVRVDHELVRRLLDLLEEAPSPDGAARFTPEAAWPAARLWPDSQDEDAVIRYYRADAVLTAVPGARSNPKLSARTRRRSPPIRHQRPYADNPLTRHA